LLVSEGMVVTNMNKKTTDLAGIAAKAATRDYYVKPLTDYRTIKSVEGPLVILDKIKFPMYNEIVSITMENGSTRQGQVLEVYGDRAVVQVKKRAVKNKKIYLTQLDNDISNILYFINLMFLLYYIKIEGV
jgi:hypothetical protein